MSRGRKRRGVLIVVVLVMGDIHPFSAGIPPTSGVGLVRPDLDDLVLLHLNLYAAVLGTEDTSGFPPCCHHTPPLSVGGRFFENKFIDGSR